MGEWRNVGVKELKTGSLEEWRTKQMEGCVNLDWRISDRRTGGLEELGNG